MGSAVWSAPCPAVLHQRAAWVAKLLRRQGAAIAHPTLRRFALEQLDFGSGAPSVPVADGEPGAEVQVDTGWMTLLEPDAFGRRRRFKAWIFAPVRSRYRFVYPVLRETTETAIEACEAAWAFYGGVFKVIIPDNTKAIVTEADPIAPRITEAFREYAQERDFAIDTARVRHPKDTARVERTVPTVRDDCFGGERLRTIDRLERLVRLDSRLDPPPAKVIPLARFLLPASQYALPLARSERSHEGEDP